MSSLALRDSNTMLRRNLLHPRRYPSGTLNLLLTPIMMLLLFVYVFGDVMSAGIGGEGADRSDYIAYIVPGLLPMTVGSTVIGAAVYVSMDMTEGLIALFALALTWIAVGMGLAGPNPEAASNMALPLILLPLISSAFIPAGTMPGWFQPIAEYQPFTPAVETLRGLLLGTEIGNNGWIAIAWCVALVALGYRWSTAQFNRDPK
ncbi:ABC transporter permease [Streptomyces vietnamensis]|uniref:ABC transporter permease n=1 Tax=Streptomyces vietnamensis TaxID=362257 RepID=UPI0034226DB1